MNTGPLDVIGDVHGNADKLSKLLDKLDYLQTDGVYRHPDRRVVFVGDLIDRGDQQLETVEIARRMVEAGQARIVMGNHEFNAIAWHTRHPQRPGDWLRSRLDAKGKKNRSQHQAFLRAVGEDSPLHAAQIAWFKTIPLWLDLGDVRFVHACWDPAAMQTLAGRLGPDNTLSDALLVAMNSQGEPEYQAIEHLLKGPEIPLPDGRGYLDKDGHPRRKARFAWWRERAATYDEAALIPADARAPDGSAFAPLPRSEISARPAKPYRDEVPLFFGHYWRSKDDPIHEKHAICVDYSAGKGGPLAAYRWNGERRLDPRQLVFSD